MPNMLFIFRRQAAFKFFLTCVYNACCEHYNEFVLEWIKTFDTSFDTFDEFMISKKVDSFFKLAFVLKNPEEVPHYLKNHAKKVLLIGTYRGLLYDDNMTYYSISYLSTIVETIDMCYNDTCKFIMCRLKKDHYLELSIQYNIAFLLL